MSDITENVLIAVEQVNKSFAKPDAKGEFIVLQNINLTIRSGEVVALLGRSGSGKSTLLRIWPDLLPILDAAVLLGFAQVTQGDVQLTPIGQDFATTTILRSKDLFRQQILQNVPLFSSIVKTLQQTRIGMRADFFRDLLSEHYPNLEADRQFSTGVDWGRYGELFEYDSREDRLYLPEPVGVLGG